MRHVADRIVDLPLVERAAAPVGEARTLVELKADPRLDQVRITDLFGLTQRHLADLGVEDRMRRLAGQVEDDFDILPAGVKDLQHLLIVDEQVEQGFKIDPRRHRIDRGGVVGVGDLDQAKFGPEGVFAHEFGVDGDKIAGLDEVDKFGECCTGFDKRMDLHVRPIQRFGPAGRKNYRRCMGEQRRGSRALRP